VAIGPVSVDSETGVQCVQRGRNRLAHSRRVRLRTRHVPVFGPFDAWRISVGLAPDASALVPCPRVDVARIARSRPTGIANTPLPACSTPAGHIRYPPALVRLGRIASRPARKDKVGASLKPSPPSIEHLERHRVNTRPVAGDRTKQPTRSTFQPSLCVRRSYSDHRPDDALSSDSSRTPAPRTTDIHGWSHALRLPTHLACTH
jgi:hypothetical protein